MIYFFTFFFSVVNVIIAKENFFTYDEKKAFRREMIEFDVQIRNLASAISLAYSNTVRSTLSKLRTSQSSLKPTYKKAMASVYKKLKQNSYYHYLQNIRQDANELHEIIDNDLKKNLKSDWEIINKRYQTILNNCRSCHLKMLE